MCVDKSPTSSRESSSGDSNATIQVDDGFESSPIEDVGAKDTYDRLEAFPFFDLPRELRENVYREPLLVDRFRLEVSHSTECVPGPLNIDLAILRVSKEVYNEALPILYNENCWISLKFDYDLSITACGKMRRPLKSFGNIRTNFTDAPDVGKTFVPALSMSVY